MSILILLFALALWGIVHSILASSFAKGIIGAARFYRLAYNIIAVISFLPILYLMTTLPDKPVFQVPAPWKFIMLAGQALAALLLLITVLQTDTLSFAGLRQLFEKEKTDALVTGGLYRLVRHPLYTFSFLLIWLSPTVSQNSLTVYIGATLYTLVGAYFEERKLLREFGEAYAAYKKSTPMLIPGLVFGKR